MLAIERCLMAKRRRTFTPNPNVKLPAWCLTRAKATADAAQPLGLVASALRRWVNQLQQERGGVTPTSKALTPERQKIQELET